MSLVQGTPRPDSRSGTTDHDTILGLGGDDALFGDDGNDTIYGHTGNDFLSGDDGNDLLIGGNGHDTIYGGSGLDTAYGDAGNDIILLTDPVYTGGGSAYGGAGNDAFILTGTDDALIRGGKGIDVMVLAWLEEHLGAVDVSISPAAGLRAGTTSGLSVDFASIEQLVLYSGNGDDSVIGGARQDFISVARGANQVDAGGGRDFVTYEIGEANTLAGGNGQDTLEARVTDRAMYFIVNQGAGTVDDGHLSDISGFETYVLRSGDGNDIVALDAGSDYFEGGRGEDTASGREGADTLWGDDGNDLLMGDAGADLLKGGRGNDDLQGGSGNDRLWGGNGDDTLTGGEDDDFLAGQQGNDLIDGGSGDDRIRLELGNDTATGGLGADTFIFAASGIGNHLITDFTSGEDSLQFEAALLQFGPGPGALDPALLNTGAAVGGDAQFVVIYDAGTDETRLIWDPNGDDPAGGVYAIARFDGNVTIAASDILVI